VLAWDGKDLDAGGGGAEEVIRDRGQLKLIFDSIRVIGLPIIPRCAKFNPIKTLRFA
jgi:hypothetical protein